MQTVLPLGWPNGRPWPIKARLLNLAVPVVVSLIKVSTYSPSLSFSSLFPLSFPPLWFALSLSVFALSFSLLSHDLVSQEGYITCIINLKSWCRVNQEIHLSAPTGEVLSGWLRLLCHKSIFVCYCTGSILGFEEITHKRFTLNNVVKLEHSSALSKLSF